MPIVHQWLKSWLKCVVVSTANREKKTIKKARRSGLAKLNKQSVGSQITSSDKLNLILCVNDVGSVLQKQELSVSETANLLNIGQVHCDASGN